MDEKQIKDEVPVLGIPLYASDIPSVTSLVLQNCVDTNRSNYCISATGAHGLVFAKSNPEFARTLKSFYLNLPDGMPGVWIGRLKGARNMKRCYGPDVFRNILNSSADVPVGHFFCGGTEGVADELKRATAEKFKNENVVGTFCPPFTAIDKYDYRSIAAKINATKANIVWIGLSTPKQELFAKRLSEFTHVNFIVTVGAAFDFHTDRVRQAPRWIQKSGLEWLFRLVMEPRRLYKRYFNIVPLFIYYNVRELFNFASLKSLKSKKS
jgi:N-acetylglucosaminyldiphosphoundecaprenol N-acetyl-beta-D-mannosaminyltransferase